MGIQSGLRGILKELKLTLKTHDKLNPKLWSEDGKIDPEVWRALNRIGKEWAEFTKIPKKAIKDVIVTGGNANYNYTDYSDIDLHLIVDKKELPGGAWQDDYLQAKKQMWALTHDIKVKGQPVELYAQDFRDDWKANQGIYSLQNNKWLQQPTRYEIDRNHPEVVRKTEDLMAQIDHLIDTNADESFFKNLKDKLRGMRAGAIAKGGEYAPENLVFKELRNRGYLDKMTKAMRSLGDKKLSLE